jgi:hypothetical protein
MLQASSLCSFSCGRLELGYMGGSYDWALLSGKGCRYTCKKTQLIQLVKLEPEFSSSIRNLESLS